MSNGLIDKVKFTGSRTGTGAITAWVRVPPYRLPTDVKAVTDIVFLETRDALDDTVWEHAWYTVGAGGQLTVYAVVDTHQRSGEYNPASPPAAISFGGPVECGAIANSVVIPAIGPDGKLLNGKAVRDSVIFPDIVTLQARNDLVDGEIFFTLSSLYTPSGGGASTGAGPGILLQYASGSAATPDGVTAFDLSSGSPGRLLKASLEVQAEFIRNQWSVYANGSGVSRVKAHALARGAAGADAAWAGIKVQRGTDAAGAYTELLLVDNDRSGGAETVFARAKSYGDANDIFEIAKPAKLPAVANKSALVSGQFARSTADEKMWLFDPDRGLGEILLSDGGPRGRVANLADLRLLTPDGYQDGEVVIVDGYLFRGDGGGFACYWASGSTATDDSIDVIKPTAHVGGASWTEAGRFLRVAPLRSQTFADADATPNAFTGALWKLAAAPPAGGYTNIVIGNNRSIILEPNGADAILKHNANGAAGRMALPNGVDFQFSSIGGPITLYQENGLVRLLSGGGSFNIIVSTQAAMKALANAINTSGKYKNKLVDDENGRTYKARGPLASDPWWPLDNQSDVEQLLPV